MRYLIGLFRALFIHRMWWWVSLFVAYFVGAGIFKDYDKYRNFIDVRLGRSLMPDAIPLWWLVIPFFLWVIATLAHREAMRYWRSAQVVFGKPYRDRGTLSQHVTDMGAHGPRTLSKALYEFDAVKVHVHNIPYKSDEGKDIVDAWAKIELFDKDSTLVKSWRDARWEDNKQPGYANHPIDHYPDDQKVRTLSANGRPSILCIAIKPIDDEFAYPFRGEDQILPDWRAKDIQIPRGNYLLRLTIGGKGLTEPAQCVFELENGGAKASLELRETDQFI